MAPDEGSSIQLLRVRNRLNSHQTSGSRAALTGRVCCNNCICIKSLSLLQRLSHSLVSLSSSHFHLPPASPFISEPLNCCNLSGSQISASLSLPSVLLAVNQSCPGRQAAAVMMPSPGLQAAIFIIVNKHAPLHHAPLIHRPPTSSKPAREMRPRFLEEIVRRSDVMMRKEL